MARKYAIGDQQAIYFVTFTVIEWIDIFIRPSYNEILVEGLKYCQKEKGLRVYAFCIMTSHIHLIISAKDPNKLSDIIREYKSYTSTSNFGRSVRYDQFGVEKICPERVFYHSPFYLLH